MWYVYQEDNYPMETFNNGKTHTILYNVVQRRKPTMSLV